MQLFCFTFAGGSASSFDTLERCIGPSIEVVKLEYAGHGARRREGFYDSFSQLAEDLYGTIESRYRAGGGYALLGYSMGCISAVETLKKILSFNEMPPPVRMFLAAHEPRTRSGPMGRGEKERDEWVKARTIQLGGVPEKLVDNKTFWRVYLPVCRADHTLIGGYDLQRLDLESKIPTTVFYSETDTPYADMTGWKRFFVGECEFVRYEGNHFFIQKHCQEMADVIKERLLRDEL